MRNWARRQFSVLPGKLHSETISAADLAGKCSHSLFDSPDQDHRYLGKYCFVITMPVGRIMNVVDALGRALGRRRRRQPTLSRPVSRSETQAEHRIPSDRGKR